MAAPTHERDVRPSCAWADVVRLIACPYKAVAGERYCVRHSIEEQVADRDRKKAAA